eukprot:scaffold9927_cov59-Phaeocystis_antarctica.AAC.3
MSVTLGVSKRSGWLNADASCRVGGHKMRARCVILKAGRWAATAPQVACTGRAEGHARSAPQRLVERRRFLPSQKEGMRCRERCGPGGERACAGAAVVQA